MKLEFHLLHQFMPFQDPILNHMESKIRYYNKENRPLLCLFLIELVDIIMINTHLQVYCFLRRMDKIDSQIVENVPKVR